MVVHLFGPPPAVDGAPEKAPRQGFCYPHWPSVDEVSRLVTCRRCNSQLDPVDVLLEVSHRHADWVRLAEETRTMRKELNALKDEEGRVKARTRAASRKDATAAVEDERRKSLTRRLEIAGKARDIAALCKQLHKLALSKDEAEEAPFVVDLFGDDRLARLAMRETKP